MLLRFHRITAKEFRRRPECSERKIKFHSFHANVRNNFRNQHFCVSLGRGWGFTHTSPRNLFAAYVHRDTAPHIYQKEHFWCFQIFPRIHSAKALFLVQKASSRLHRLSKIRISNQLGFFLYTLSLLIRRPWNAVFGCLFSKLQPREDRRIWCLQHKRPETYESS